MRQAHRRVGGIHRLTSRTGGAVSILADVVHVQVHFYFIHLGEYGYRSSGGMYPSLRLGSRYALYPVYARFVFEHAVHICSRDGGDDFFVAPCGAEGQVQDGELPVLHFAEALVHSEEVPCKNRCLVSSSTATNFKDTILGIVRVFGGQELLEFFFQLDFFLTKVVQFRLGHFSKFRILFLV